MRKTEKKMSDLKQQLINLGYSDEQSNSIVNKERVYFQNNVDDITNKVRTTTEDRYAKNYVHRDEYNSLVRELKTNNIKQEYLKSGGNEKYFNDFIKVNDDLYGDGGMSRSLSQRLKDSPWALSQNPKLEDYGINSDEKSSKKPLTTIYGKWNNFK